MRWGKVGARSARGDNERRGLDIAQAELIFTRPAAVHLECEGVRRGGEEEGVRERIRNERMSESCDSGEGEGDVLPVVRQTPGRKLLQKKNFFVFVFFFPAKVPF